VSTVLPGEHGKIQGWHRDRLAVVYVRQSSRQQVVDHGESTRLQYGLAARAAALGWPASRVMVIDEDLGRSAADPVGRPGFARLVAEITMGHVGLAGGLEMSRLARAGRDWHQLIELCSLAGALLADADGVYDPNWHNDRLLLGRPRASWNRSRRPAPSRRPAASLPPGSPRICVAPARRSATPGRSSPQRCGWLGPA
jgi:hypothetical protein